MKLHFISLGCPKNLVDSEVMLAQLVGEGYELIDDPKLADVITVNTCAFVEDAKKEAIDTILQMVEFKKEGSCKLLIVTGCLPQRYESELVDLIPEVDIFVGTGEFHRIADLIKQWTGEQRVEVARPEYIYDHTTPRLHTGSKHVAYLKIAEGCFHPCSFCIIPKLRGAFRSRPMESIIDEARMMIEGGVREINLIAQDTTAYGRDIGVNLQALLTRLEDLPGRRWFRLLYAYPHGFPDSVIEAIGIHPDICSYVDLPIQHISDGVLARMGREGEGAEIRSLIQSLRRHVPDISLRTTLIVGFPGETDEEYHELVDFICETKFDHLGVFTFSPEEGTKAAQLTDQIPHDVAERRRAEIMDVQRDISLANKHEYLGQTLLALIDGSSSETDMLLEGRHRGQAPEIDGVIYINEGLAAAGDFTKVEITEAHEYDLVGRIVG